MEKEQAKSKNAASAASYPDEKNKRKFTAGQFEGPLD